MAANLVKIGFIGQGWIGKNYADNFEARGFNVVRYALEKPYAGNKEKIKECDIVFIAVPTPTAPAGFDDHIVRDVVKLVGKGKIAVIKSTVLPGTTESIQDKNPDIVILHVPEFLTEQTSKSDIAHPFHNVVGMARDTKEHHQAAELVLETLPRVKSEVICSAKEAEFFKYLRNNYLFTKYVFLNIYYDIMKSSGVEWPIIRDLIAADPWMGSLKFEPVHKGGRGAGNHCHIKDFAAMRAYAERVLTDALSLDVLRILEKKNIELLRSTGKDLELLADVYGS